MDTQVVGVAASLVSALIHLHSAHLISAAASAASFFLSLSSSDLEPECSEQIPDGVEDTVEQQHVIRRHEEGRGRHGNGGGVRREAEREPDCGGECGRTGHNGPHKGREQARESAEH